MKASAAKRSAWTKLLSLVSQPVHDYRPTTDVFLDVDVDKAANDLQLVLHGGERGADNRPAQEAQTPDDIEHKIVERSEAHKQSAQAIYLDQLRTYDQRLAALNFEERFATIQQAVPEALSDFAADAGLGRDELFSLRRRLYDSEQEREQFRAKHRIVRPARVSSTGKIVMKIGLLAVLFVIEVLVNGSFLAESNLGGMLGGTTQAVGFAALNIIASFMFGLFLIRLLNRRNFFLKFIGVLGLLTYLAFAVVLNLVLAHLREMPASINQDTGTFVNVGSEVLMQMLSAPHVLHDANSWAFFGIGFLFSLIAMIDGLVFTDPYFGYASLQKRVDEAHEQYTGRKAELIAELRDIRDNVSKVLNEAARDLSIRRSEFDAILQHRGHLSTRFAEHQNHIERSCNALLSIYREANRKTRKNPAPDYFSKPYSMDRIAPAGRETAEGLAEKLASAIEETQATLKEHIKAINETFDGAVRTYHEIDTLIPENRVGATAAKAA